MNTNGAAISDGIGPYCYQVNTFYSTARKILNSLLFLLVRYINFRKLSGMICLLNCKIKKFEKLKSCSSTVHITVDSYGQPRVERLYWLDQRDHGERHCPGSDVTHLRNLRSARR